MSDETTLTWHLLAFDKNTERLVADITLSNDQFMALRPHLGMANTDDHFGSYPLSSVLWFVEEHMDGE